MQQIGHEVDWPGRGVAQFAKPPPRDQYRVCLCRQLQIQTPIVRMGEGAWRRSVPAAGIEQRNAAAEARDGVTVDVGVLARAAIAQIMREVHTGQRQRRRGLRMQASDARVHASSNLAQRNKAEEWSASGN